IPLGVAVWVLMLPPPPVPPVVFTFSMFTEVPDVAPANILTEPLVPVPPPPVVIVVGTVTVPELAPLSANSARVKFPPFLEPVVVKDPSPLILICPPVLDAPLSVTVVVESPEPGGRTGLLGGIGLALAPAMIVTSPPAPDALEVFMLDPLLNTTSELLISASA